MTVCHHLGNGSYHLLTMDDSALKAHLGHDDLYPVPAGGCPTADAPEPETTAAGETAPETSDEETAELVPSSPTDLDQVLGLRTDLPPRVGLPAAVLGVQLERTTSGLAPRVAPVQATTTGAAPAVAPATGVLPQTGAGQVGMTLAAGLCLLAAGAGLLSRRRLHGTR